MFTQISSLFLNSAVRPSMLWSFLTIVASSERLTMTGSKEWRKTERKNERNNRLIDMREKIDPNSGKSV